MRQTGTAKATYRKTERPSGWPTTTTSPTHTQIDCVPKTSYAAHPRAVAARIKLERYLRAPHDAYRYFNPTGRGTTHDIEERPARTTRDGRRTIPGRPFHQARIDAINIASSLTQGSDGCFMKAEHVAPQHYGVHWHPDFSKQQLYKRSDHSLIKLTYRTTKIPRPKAEPTFASEIMHSARGRNMIRQATRTTLTEGTDDTTDAKKKQELLVQAWMQMSVDFRKEEQGIIRRKVAAASHKMAQFIKMRNAAVGTENLRAAQVQLKRAEQQYAKALAERQVPSQSNADSDTTGNKRATHQPKYMRK